MLASVLQRLHMATHRLALGMALLGGLVLLLLVLLTTLSILGRELAALSLLSEWLGPVPGDYELIELGMGFAIFAFLPWAHWSDSHASVDLLAPFLGNWGNHLAHCVRDALMAALALLLARQLWLGMLDKQSYQETSFILQVPLWWGYAAALLGAAVFAFAACVKLAVTLFLQDLDEDHAPGDGI